MRWLKLAAVTVPPLVLAGVGVTHPHDLTAATAEWWTDMHIILIPVFPLLAVGQWILLSGMRGILPWIARIAGFGYIGFYTALDTLAGIGTGTLVQEGMNAGTGGHHGEITGRDEAITWIFKIGNDLGDIGAYCFVAASLATAIALYLRIGVRALPGGIVLVAASWFFSQEHIYWPAGVFSQLGLALGFAALAYVLPDDTPAAKAVAPGGQADAAEPAPV